MRWTLFVPSSCVHVQYEINKRGFSVRRIERISEAGRCCPLLFGVWVRRQPCTIHHPLGGHVSTM